MNFEQFCNILNKHIFEEEKRELLRKIADSPQRFLGLFRPTKPNAKILQHLLQSHEIKFGNAMEELLSLFLKQWGYQVFDKIIFPDPSNLKRRLDIDQYFKIKESYYFIEQKIRDDHDSSKKEGQIRNFEKKLEYLYQRHHQNLIGIMYFIDPDMAKNKDYYLRELKNMQEIYGVKLILLYGKELFEHFKKPDDWNNLILWLSKWKENLPELPDINLDNNPQANFEKIKDLEIRCWRKILENEKLWQEGIIKVLFRNGTTLILIKEFFKKKPERVYHLLADLIEKRIKEYY